MSECIRIMRAYYPVLTLGPGRRIGIWTTGCARACEGCMSPEMQDAAGGRNVRIDALVDRLCEIRERVDGVTISGGEPFMQAAALDALTARICERLTRDIIVYSGYTLDALQTMRDPAVDGVLARIAALIDGAYVAALDDGVGARGSSNQRVIAFRDEARYLGMATGKRRVQTITHDGRTLLIGLIREESDGTAD